MRFTCRSCGRTYLVAQELSGLAFKMKCKTCGQVISVRPAAPPPSPPRRSGTGEARPQTKPLAGTPPEPPKAPPPVQAAPVPQVAAAPAPEEARPPRPPRDAERPEAAARPAEPVPPRPRHRRMPNPRLLQPTFVLSAILAVLVAVYFFLNRDLGAKPAQRPLATPLQVAPRPDASAAPRQPASAPEPVPPKVAPSPDPAGRPTTAGARLP